MKWRGLSKILVCSFLMFGCEWGNSHSVDLLQNEPSGTEPRLEREFKFVVDGRIEDYSGLGLAYNIRNALGKADFAEDYWLDDEPQQFVFMDIYFDTEEALAYEYDISYRLRQRYKDFSESEPYRMEFQAKVGRTDLGDGFSEVVESRFEFRDESQPFSDDNPAPRPPWNLAEYIEYFKQGRYQDYVLWPAYTVMEYLAMAGVEGERFVFEPELVLVTERARQHLNLETPWGSGPNPEQVFIVTVDTVDVYDFVDFAESPVDAKVVGSFREIEVEFERNVSTMLDQEILDGNVELENVRGEFLADQRKIMEVVEEVFGAKGIGVQPSEGSKYRQAYDLINEKS